MRSKAYRYYEAMNGNGTTLSVSTRLAYRFVQKTLRWTAALLLLLVCSSANTQSAATTQGDEAALIAATKALCHTEVAMLGESSTHGDGQTVVFKGALIERLIDQCGFDSVYFEASHYQFIHLNRELRTGTALTTGDLLAAVGGLWEFDQEFQPLASFLMSKAQGGEVFLGGLDDQLGQYGQDYANIVLVSNLTKLLPQAESQECSAALHRRIYSDYTDAQPYSTADRARLNMCLAEIDHAAMADKVVIGEDLEERQEMISAAKRWISRDFTSEEESIVNRDRSMFQDFEWLQNHQPKRRKVIVWAATVHIAKRADPTWGDHAGTNFGLYIHQKYGEKACSLGFSAVSGSYRQGGRQTKEMPAVPIDSVEASVLHSADSLASFIGSAQLAAMGAIPGAFFQHSYESLPWSTFLDGAVIFQAEHTPLDLRRKQ